jgi:hypothetical protein
MSNTRLPTQPRTFWTADELMAWTFADPRWAVPGILAEGANLLAGPPKVGKSWLALNLGVAVAAGGKVLGSIDVEAGDVLYLALEDTGRRLQNRLGKVLATSPASPRLGLATFCEPLQVGGYERICAWLEEHPDARLVVVDVLARIRGKASPNASAYELDYAAMSAIKAIADKYEVAFLVVHHTRKAGASDYVDIISGTQGLAGAADAILVMQRARGQQDATLNITGRDVEEAEYPLRFSSDLGAWQMLDGPAEDYTLGDTRLNILRHLREIEAATPKELSLALGIDYELAKKTASRMAHSGQLDTDGRGNYFVPVTLSPLSPLSPNTEDGDTGDTSLSPTNPALTRHGDSRDTRDTPTEGES